MKSHRNESLSLEGTDHIYAANDWSPGRGFRYVRYVKVEVRGRFEETRYFVSVNQ